MPLRPQRPPPPPKKKPENYGFSDDFMGNSSWLICLNVVKINANFGNDLFEENGIGQKLPSTRYVNTSKL